MIIVGNLSWEWLEGSLLNRYYSKVKGKVLLHSQDFSTLPLIFTL